VDGAVGEEIAGEPGEEDDGAIGLGVDVGGRAIGVGAAGGAGTELFLSPSRRPFPPLAAPRRREPSSGGGCSMAAESRNPRRHGGSDTAAGGARQEEGGRVWQSARAGRRALARGKRPMARGKRPAMAREDGAMARCRTGSGEGGGE
jgi:hypothetical protein